MADIKTSPHNLIVGDTIEFDRVDQPGLRWGGEVNEFLSDGELEVFGDDPGEVYDGKIPVFKV